VLRPRDLLQRQAGHNGAVDRHSSGSRGESPPEGIASPSPPPTRPRSFPVSPAHYYEAAATPGLARVRVGPLCRGGACHRLGQGSRRCNASIELLRPASPSNSVHRLTATLCSSYRCQCKCHYAVSVASF